MKYLEYLDAPEFVTAAALDLKKSLASTAAVMLSGGKTPFPIFESSLVEGAKLSSSKIIMMSDERYVLPSSPDCNSTKIFDYIQRWGGGNSNFIYPDTSLEMETCRQQFASVVANFFKQGGALEVAYLGLGADGHTAGIFNDQQVADISSPVLRTNRPDGLLGITLNAEIICRAQRIVFWVAGRSKQKVVEKFLNEPRNVIAGRVVAGNENVEIWFCPFELGE